MISMMAVLMLANGNTVLPNCVWELTGKLNDIRAKAAPAATWLLNGAVIGASAYLAYSFYNTDQSEACESSYSNALTSAVASYGITVASSIVLKNTLLAIGTGLLMQLPKVGSIDSCILNPVPDQVIEATGEYNYPQKTPLDTKMIFKDQTVGLLRIREQGSTKLPEWLKLVSYLPPSQSFLIPGGGDVQRITLRGDVAYVAAGDAGLQILNVSNPKNISVLGNYTKSGLVVPGIDINGNTVYAASFSDNLQILDVTNPQDIKLLAIYPLPGLEVLDVAISDNIAFIATQGGLGGLQVLEILNPQNITKLGFYGGTNVFSVAIKGNTLYSIAGNDLKIFDVSNPKNIKQLADYVVSTTVDVNSVTITGNTAYVGTNGGLEILDVSNPKNITVLGAYFSGPWTVIGSTAYVASGADGLQIIDLTQGYLQGDPTLVLSGRKYVLEVIGNNCTDTFLLTIDQLPRRTTTGFTMVTVFPEQFFTQPLDGLFEHPAQDVLTLSVLLKKEQFLPPWLKVTLNPTLIVKYDNSLGTVEDIVISGTTAYLAYFDAGLHILNVADLKNIILLGNYTSSATSSSAFAAGVTVSGTMAYLAYGWGGLHILNVTDPKNIVLLRNYTRSDGSAKSVTVSGTMAYLAYGGAGLHILNVADPKNIVLLGNYTIQGDDAFCVMVYGTTAYLAYHKAGLHVLNVADPKNMVLLGNYTLPEIPGGDARGVTVSGTRAYLAYGSAGLHILDVEDPKNILLLGNYTIPGVAANGVTVSGTTAYLTLSYSNASLHILNVADPKNILPLGNYTSFGDSGLGVTLSGKTAYVSFSYRRIFHVLDITRWLLSGKPTKNDVGNYQFELTAKDSVGGKASDTFILRVEGPPQLIKSPDIRYAKVGKAFTYFISEGVFADPNNDSLIFATKKNNEQTLPFWLSFSSISAIFAGTPPEMTNQTFNIFLSATDNIRNKNGDLEYANTTFQLYVDHAPEVKKTMPDQNIKTGQTYNKTFDPAEFFKDLDGDVLSCENASALPNWLQFSNTGGSLTFWGTPLDPQADSAIIKLKIKDPYQGEVLTDFRMNVYPNKKPDVIGAVSGVQDAPIGEVYNKLNLDMETLFKDPNGDTLKYSASNLPKWAVFKVIKPPYIYQITGKPKRSDLNFFTDKVDKVILKAKDDDELWSEPLTFDIKTTGMSYGELLFKIIGPIGSGLTVAYTAWLKQDLIINQWNKWRGRYFRPDVVMNEELTEIPLETPSKDIGTVQALVKPEEKKSWYKLGVYAPFPGGALLPHWLCYNAKENRLEMIKERAPQEDSLVIRIKNKRGIIREEFPLIVNLTPVQKETTSHSSSQSSSMYEDSYVYKDAV